jgi:hypothetical protein
VMEPVIIQLKHPIVVGSETIASLSFRPLKAKDLRRLKAKEPMAQTLELAGYLSGKPASVIDELMGEDLLEVIDVVGGFFDRSQETGGEPSPSSE